MTPNEFQTQSGSLAKKYKSSIKYQARPLEFLLQAGLLPIKQNNQKKSVVSKSKNSSIQSRQVKVDIVYSIQKNGTKYGCKICLPHKVFANYTLMYQHFSQIHDIFPLVSMCKDCQKDSVHPDLNENDFKEHCCKETPYETGEGSNQISEKFEKSKRQLVLKLHKVEEMYFSSNSEGQKYECEKCCHDSVFFPNFRQHLKRKHEVPLIFNCKNCNYRKILQDFNDNQFESYLEEHKYF